MPVKKKKGKKKKKSKGSAGPKDEAPLEKNLPPPYRDPVIDAPVAKLVLILANPNAGFFRHEVNMKVSKCLYSLQSEIKKMHGGSI